MTEAVRGRPKQTQMTLIRKPTQLEAQKTVKAMIYGQAGTGKTTMALSAPRTLLLDFDGGVHRVNMGHQTDTVPVHNWKEANDVLTEDLSNYETVAVDTVGRMMDYIILHVCSGGIPQIRDWSRINQEFSNFTRNVSLLNKNIIYVAHRDVRHEGDDNVFIPALREKNYTAIVTELDLLGYVEAKGRERTITFDPTSRNDGKNTCNLPGLMKIPTVVDSNGNALENTFFRTQIIAPYIANQQKRAEANRAYEAVMEELRDNIALITDEVGANDFVGRIDNFTHVGNSKVMAGLMMKKKAEYLGLKLNGEKRYEKAAG
jgi:adenosyl cobinamide kinase/adenosyl cobinamide phosphate guanylyltransferase